jgi:hypothetical protein
MLGLLLIYFIWKFYTDLAVQYRKNKWGYALLGIASYYAGALTAGFIIGVVATIQNPAFVDETSDAMIALMTLPFGILAVWGLHRFLKKRWSSNNPGFVPPDTLDSDLLKPGSGD